MLTFRATSGSTARSSTTKNMKASTPALITQQTPQKTYRQVAAPAFWPRPGPCPEVDGHGAPGGGWLRAMWSAAGARTAAIGHRFVRPSRRILLVCFELLKSRAADDFDSSLKVRLCECDARARVWKSIESDSSKGTRFVILARWVIDYSRLSGCRSAIFVIKIGKQNLRRLKMQKIKKQSRFLEFFFFENIWNTIAYITLHRTLDLIFVVFF